MPMPVRQTRTALPSVAPHCVLLFSSGLSCPFQTIGGRLWRAKTTPGPAFGPPLHVWIVDPAVAVADQGRETILERLVVRPLTDEPLLPSMWVKPPLNVASRRQRWPSGPHRPADGRVGRLVAARVEAERGQGVVEPGDVGDDARIVALGAEGRDEHRRTPVDKRAGPLPDAFTGQRVGTPA